MPLSREVGLGAGDIVLDGDPAPPHFWSMSVVAKWSPISDISEHLFLRCHSALGAL